MIRPRYFVSHDGTLYRRAGQRTQVFSRYSTGDWCDVQVPVRYPLRRVCFFSAMVRLARARWIYRRFVRAVGAR